MLSHQSKIESQLEEVAELVKPIVATGKKITQREINKAQELINEKYGYYDTYINEYNKETVNIPFFSIYKDFQYYFSPQIKIYAQDRYVKFGVDQYGNTDGAYLPNDTKVIYLSKDKTISEEEYQKFITKDRRIYQKSEIITLIRQYQRLEEDIQKLKDKQDKIKYHYYIKS